MEAGDSSDACPKCGRRRERWERACARCGLAVERWARFAAEAVESPLLSSLWAGVVDRWDDAAAHDRLLSAASDADALPQLARRYRVYLASHAGDAVAEKRLAQIATLVETAARMQASRPVSPRTSRALWLAGYAVAALLLAASLWLVFKLIARR